MSPRQVYIMNPSLKQRIHGRLEKCNNFKIKKTLKSAAETKSLNFKMEPN